MNGGSHLCIGPLNTEGVSLNVNSKGVGDSYDSNSQGIGISRSWIFSGDRKEHVGEERILCQGYIFEFPKEYENISLMVGYVFFPGNAQSLQNNNVKKEPLGSLYQSVQANVKSTISVQFKKLTYYYLSVKQNRQEPCIILICVLCLTKNLLATMSSRTWKNFYTMAVIVLKL